MPDSIVKVFDTRTFAIVPFSTQPLPNPSCLTKVDENRGEFVVSNIQGSNCIYSLHNGLTAMQQTTVCIWREMLLSSEILRMR